MSVDTLHPAEREAFERAAGPPEPEGPEVVRLWQGGDGFWHWAYSDGDGTRLESNRSYPNRTAAVESAGIAYPGIPLVEHDEGRPTRAGGRLGRRLIVAGVVTGALGAVLALVGLGTLVVAGLALRTLLRRIARRLHPR